MRLARAIAAKRGGLECLDHLARLDDEDRSLGALRLPELAGHLDFFEPERFPDRGAVRAFVRGDAFAAFVAMARSALIGRDGRGDLASHVDADTLRDAREALFYALGDLQLLAATAAVDGHEPLAFTARFRAYEPAARAQRLAALAQLAAREAHEGAPPDAWMPVLDALRAAADAVARREPL